MFNDHQRCYRIVKSQDRRFDGYFVTAVRTTGIYCRPSCPARTPKSSNVDFYPTAAAAQGAGFRACKRCLPNASPGSPTWNTQADVAARAMRLIADGVVDRDGVSGLANRLGYSERQLNRVLLESVGASPLALARSQRADHARTLVETTDLAMVDVAFGAGFSSLRQFNDTMRAIFDATPTELRSRRGRMVEVGDSDSAQTLLDTHESAVAIPLRLPYRAPLDADSLMKFLGRRCIEGVERVEDDVYIRTLRLPRGDAVVSLRIEERWVAATLRLECIGDLATAVARCRRLLDLDADPVAIDEALEQDAVLAPLIAQRRGLRSPGAVDGYEMALRAILGQQVSVSAGITAVRRLVQRYGETSSITDGETTRQFPDPAAIAGLDPSEIGVPRRRAAALIEASSMIASGELHLDAGVDRAGVRAQLLEISGIGPWTADYICMRALNDPDIWAGGDLVVRQQAEHLGLGSRELEDRAGSWAPWRTTATHHLWASGTNDQP